MTVKQLIAKLQAIEKHEPRLKVLVSSDEELNSLFEDFEVQRLEGEDGTVKHCVIYGLSGSEVEL